MRKSVEIEGRAPVVVGIRRNRHARRLSLRVSDIDGRTTLTAPSWVAERDILRFLEEKQDWLRSALPEPGAAKRVAPGAVICVEGWEHRIAQSNETRGAARLERGEIHVPGLSEATGRRVGALFKVMARDRLSAQVETCADVLNRAYGQIRLRDTRSRWGSCSAQGDLMFCWRLIMAPPEVLNYVAAHEVAHLVEMNHSPRFWATVERLQPKFAEPRAWLKANGRTLLAWRFGD